jgi:hypothetical protein
MAVSPYENLKGVSVSSRYQFDANEIPAPSVMKGAGVSVEGGFGCGRAS